MAFVILSFVIRRRFALARQVRHSNNLICLG